MQKNGVGGKGGETDAAQEVDHSFSFSSKYVSGFLGRFLRKERVTRLTFYGLNSLSIICFPTEWL